MTLDDLRALADKFFVWQEGSGRQTVTTFSALLFAQHVLQLREKSLGAENSASTPTLRDAAQQALEALAWHLDRGTWGADLEGRAANLRAALEQQAEPEPEPVAWRELCRRLYVELFHCDQQMMATLDEDGEPVWTQGKTVRDVLADAKAALDTSPPASKPLTEEQIEVAAKSVPAAVCELMHGHEITVEKFRAALAEFARAVERAHGIEEEK